MSLLLHVSAEASGSGGPVGDGGQYWGASYWGREMWGQDYWM